MSHKILTAALSDIGCVRTNNEDSFGYDPDRQVFVVCDGMGGMAAGEVASQTAVATFLATVATGDSSLPIESLLNKAILAANGAVHQAGLDPAHKGMGTTLVAACVRDLKLYVANVGDSRAYLIKDGQCTQITIDHSYLNELIRSGVVDVKDAKNVDVQGMQTVITRAIGVEPNVLPDFFSTALEVGDTVLLASDGLTRYVDGSELTLLSGSCDLETSAHTLVALAKERGGTDNITVLLLQVAGEPSPELSQAAGPEAQEPTQELEPASSPEVSHSPDRQNVPEQGEAAEEIVGNS